MLLNVEKHRLWVEGNDDKFVISNLLNRRITPQPFPNNDAKTWIVSTPSKTGGFDDALSAFALALKNGKYERVGLVVDRDTEKHARWRSVTKALADLEKVAPPAIPEEGLVVSETAPSSLRWGVWLMPDNRNFGELENFVLSLGATHGDLYKHAEASVDSAKSLPGAFQPKDQTKATLHTYLASVREPGRPYGEAIATGHFGEKSAEADAFVLWFERLFM